VGLLALFVGDLHLYVLEDTGNKRKLVIIKPLIPSIFWDVTRHRLVVGY
jgi:hypothetical protein